MPSSMELTTSSSTPEDVRKLSIAKLRSIAADAEHMLGLLGDVESKLTIDDEKALSRELKTVLQEAKPRFLRDLEQIKSSFDKAQRAATGDVEIELYFSGTLTRLENEIEDIDGVWPSADKPRRAQRVLTRLKEALENIRAYAGVLSLPTFVNEALEQISPGAGIDYHDHFAGLLPREKDRQWGLDYLKKHPRRIGGVVDAETGYIFRVSLSKIRRIGSVAIILGAAVFGYALLYSLILLEPHVAPSVLAWPFQGERLQELTLAYVAVIAGGLVHLVIDFLKQSRSSGNKYYWGTTEWLMLIHVKEMQFLKSILSFIVVVIGSAFLVERIDILTAFFFGYSVDSILDVIFQRFETFAESGKKKALAAVS